MPRSSDVALAWLLSRRSLSAAGGSPRRERSAKRLKLEGVARKFFRAVADRQASLVQKSQGDFTNTFRDLSLEDPPAGDRYRHSDFSTWHARWLLRLAGEGRSKSSACAAMRAVNPDVIARNRRVEVALADAQERHDLSTLHRLLTALASPYEAGSDSAPYQDSSPDDANYRTYCGT